MIIPDNIVEPTQVTLRPASKFKDFVAKCLSLCSKDQMCIQESGENGSDREGKREKELSGR